ncbi:uncharacterized protein [Primulina eburnea]|uniref:uncharacterized protein isoform X2 n=1 Tax=Primulina eburnea TaxID=1245227 RepID=UPI003C6C751F
MKRRRGSKKGKAKKPKLLSATVANDVVSNMVSLNTEENSPLDDSDNMVDSGTDNETKPSPPEGGQPEALNNTDSVGRPVNNTSVKAVYTRVKVKIKTSKNLESHHTSSDAPTLSDTEKSSQHFGSEKQLVPNDRMGDSSNSLSETKEDVSGTTSKKSMGIKIKSSKGFGCSSMSPCSHTETVKGDRTEKKDVELVYQHSKNNEQELKAVLEVIRKVMKMDAAEPFNVPVNPVALGIPDYFDVIDTPMDFGTICSNLEKGVKYRSSEDVFRDVQYIWDNCYKYNNKGDYIVELMKRVRKNFTKYWTTVGLFNDDQPQETDGVDSTPVTDIPPSSQGNTPMESGAFSHLGKKFHGLKKHKEGCQCAICVMMRRRQEREEIVRMMGGTDGSDDSVGEDMRPESPFGMYASSNIENHLDAERQGQDMKLGHIRNLYSQAKENDVTITGEREVSEDLAIGHRSGDENTQHLASGGSISSETKKEMHVHEEDGNAALDQQKPKEFLDKKQRAKMLENLRYLENPILLKLCGTLFADNSESFWNGPHSLVGRPRRRTSFHSAISKFME